jgi:hypothetical protein
MRELGGFSLFPKGVLADRTISDADAPAPVLCARFCGACVVALISDIGSPGKELLPGLVEIFYPLFRVA